MKREEFVETVNAVIATELPCLCSKAYTTRDKIDPTCPWHIHGEGLAELIAKAVYPEVQTCGVNDEDENVCGKEALRSVITGKPYPFPVCADHWAEYFQRPGYTSAPIV